MKIFENTKGNFEITFKEDILENLFNEEITSSITNESNTIYLSDSGFSEDVGIFDPVTRIATLTQDINEKILIIETSNIVLDGNNFSIINLTLNNCIVIENNLTSITIKNLLLQAIDGCINGKSYLTSIIFENINFLTGYVGFASSRSENISINNCKFTTNIGIALSRTLCTKINCNVFNLTEIGVLLYRNVQNTLIEDNSFLNNPTSIYIFNENLLNIIRKNKFTVNLPISPVLSINFGSTNTFNKIEDNIFLYENVTFKLQADSLSISNNFIYWTEKNNSFNTICKNSFLIKNNTFSTEATKDADLRFYCIGGFSLNVSNEIYNNIFITSNNTFNMNSMNTQNIFVVNLLVRDASNLIIYKNHCRIIDNTINFNESDINIVFENIAIGPDNISCKVSKNDCAIIDNSIYSPSKNISYTLKSRNISLGLNVKTTSVRKNILSIQSNPDGESVSIQLSDMCTGNEISKNNIINTTGFGISLNKKNVANLIVKNYIKSTSIIAIALVDSNISNIIKENIICGYGRIGIYLGLNNINNLFTCNTVSNEKIAILISDFTNNFNTISYNKFCNNSINILGEKTGYNYIFSNIVVCY